MKKVFLSLAAIAVVACMASCNKVCTCKTYAAGVVVSTEEDIELDKDSYKSCEELSAIVIENPKTGIECF